MVLPHNAYIKANIIDTAPGQTPDKCPSSTQNAAAWSTFLFLETECSSIIVTMWGNSTVSPYAPLGTSICLNSLTMLSPLDNSVDGEIK